MLLSMIGQEQLIALCHRFDPRASILRTEKLTGGVSAEVQRVTLATRDGRTRELVVRSHREFSGKSDPALRATREYQILSSLAVMDQPVPRPCAYDPPFTLLLEWVEGSSAMPSAPADPLAALIAGVHDSGVTLADEPFVDPLPMLREWLPAMTIPQTLPALNKAHLTLVHGDYWPGNVLWHHGAVAALIDWEDASMGDCLIDVAAMRAELYRLTNRQTVDEFTRAYTERRGIDEGRLAWWDLFMASAQLMYMDSWGLPPAELQQRGDAMSRWQRIALTALGHKG
ncbi:MAG: phosphotransferase family protein [Pseudomonadales bacterium]|jgi:aminoglycoside phosphotransferase (APT) family kinase protein